MNLHFAKYLDRYVGIILCYTLAALHLFREMIRPREEPIRVRRILLTKFWGFGNIVLLLPILEMVRKRFPDAEVHFLTLDCNAGLLADNPNVDRVWAVNEGGAFALLGSLIRTVAGLRRTKIDLFLDFEQFARTSTLVGFLAGAPQRVGLKTPRQGRYLLYTAPVRYRENQHMSLTFLDIARAGGVREETYEPAPLAYAAADGERVAALLDGADGPLVVAHPGSGDNFVGRRWPPASFARLLDILVREHGAVPVMSGAASEGQLVREVLAEMEERTSAVDLSGRLSLRELAALLDRACLLVANDTGPVHLASGLGRPVLGLYGPNTPVLYGPLSPGSRSFYKGLACSPCITNLNYKTSFCRFPVCIRNITVEEVATEAGRLLSGSGATL